MNRKETFLQTVERSVELFPQNGMCRLLDAGKFSMGNYHSILLMIFHQTYEGPSTFSLAAAHCPLNQSQAREYLQAHADEEKLHWQWVINDLKNTGYAGPDPRQNFPQTACQAYVAFNVYTAMRAPLARLAIAVVLESIGAKYGKIYATKICETLELKPNQAVFFFGHGDTDVGHAEDLLNVIEGCRLSDADWDWMIHAAATAGKLYKAMYDEAAGAA